MAGLRPSIRNILFVVVGLLTAIITGLAAKDVYGDWRRWSDLRELEEASSLSDQLFDATEKLAVERDVALAMLDAPDADTIDDMRPRLKESRAAVDAALAPTILTLAQYPLPELSTLVTRIRARLGVIRALRPEIDKALMKPREQRPAALSEHWSAELTALVIDTQDLWIGFVGHYTGIDPIVTQHLWLKHYLRTIADYAGRERSLIGRLIAESVSPTQEQVAQLLSGEGIVSTSWQMSRNLALQGQIYPAIAPAYGDASSHYSTMQDMIQDMFYVADVEPGSPTVYPIGLDLWFELSMQAADSLGVLRDSSIKATHDYVASLIGGLEREIALRVVIFVVALMLCGYSFFVISRRVIAPINGMIGALLQASRGVPVPSFSVGVQNDEIGKLAEVLDAFQRNVEDGKRTAAQLVQAQKMEAVGQLTGGIAHDFNNLLTIVIGNLEFIETYVETGSEMAEPIDMALRASLRGADLTRQLLAFSRRQPLEPKSFDLNALVTGTAELLGRTLGERIEVRLRLSEGLATALADPAQVESALANLAINARDAMPQGGRLMIETANAYLDEDYAADKTDVTPGDYVMLAVSDTGHGMPPEVLNRVFEPFFTTKAEGKGTGLGLSMVYGFAKQSRGHLIIYSEVGHGTTVRLYLPKAGGEAESAAEEALVQSAPTESETVLVVEDNEGVRRVAVRLLKELGYRIVEADGPAPALAILASDQPIGLLFTDVVMPGEMTGDELARQAMQLRPGLRVLFTSGFAEGALWREGSSSIINFQNLLSKPYRKQDLARRVREALTRSPAMT